MKKTKVVVVGNCQARPLAMAFERLSQDVEVTAVAIVHLLKSDRFEEYRHYFEQADYIVSQLVAENYPCDFVRTEFLKEKYGQKVVSIVNLYFTGYTPDWFYIRIPGKGPLRGPMGDYHNKTIVKSWKEGLPAEKAAELFLDKDYNLQYEGDKEASLVELRGRERISDVKITDFIESQMFSERLFFTFNHPAARLLVEYSKRMLRIMRVSFDDSVVDFEGKEPLSKFCPPVNPISGFPISNSCLSKGVEVIFKGSDIVLGDGLEYAPSELVNKFYSVYDFCKHEAAFRDNVQVVNL